MDDADQIRLRLNARYGKGSGPLFTVRCQRCKVEQQLAIYAAIDWLKEHQKLHDAKRKEGQAF